MASSVAPNYLQGEPSWAQEVLAYWFGKEDVLSDNYEHRFALWYRGGPEVDAEILHKFEPLLLEVKQRHASGELESYKSSPRASLALVILLDQMSRNMYRGDPRMFETDGIAQGIVFELLASGGYESLAPVERLFLCVALEHAEDIDVVRRPASLMGDLTETCPVAQRNRFLAMFKYNKQHLDIIEEFGRYPHRNQILQRETSSAEAAFLAKTSYGFMRSVNKKPPMRASV